MEDEKYTKEIFSDEAFIRELLVLEEPWEVQAALKEKGVEMTEGEIISLRDEIMTMAGRIAEGGELSLEQLEEAAGGSFITTSAVAVAAGAIIFTLGALGVTTVGLGGCAVIGFALSQLNSLRW